MLPQLSPFFPKTFNRYIEPFVGGGAVYFYIHARYTAPISLLTDLNAELIQCYQVVQTQCEALIEQLTLHRQNHSREYYDCMRAQQPQDLTPVIAAARFLYLNRTCYNGLYRVNSRGQFNVPMGSHKRLNICPKAQLRAASDALTHATFYAVDFANFCLTEARAGDFIYFDPPYHPISPTARFTHYTPNPFGRGDQLRLADVYTTLALRGCTLMLSNADTEFIRALYKDYRIVEIQGVRSISANPTRRGTAKELLVLNF